MATTKKNNTYNSIGEDLDYLEEKLQHIKTFLDANPYHLVEDRLMTVGKDFDSDGNMVNEYYKLAATKEAQHKSILLAIKECAQILEVLKGMRDREEAKNLKLRGESEMSILAKNFTNK